MSSNQHLYFCIDSTCNNIVDHYNAPCCLEHNPLVQGNEETLSHETSECPGCGMDLYVGANGYCSHCWVERFGYDEDDMASPKSFNESHKCSGEWDYERGVHVCDFADEPECPQHKCTAKFNLESGLWECVNEKPHTCSDTWTYDYSPREKYPPLPPSPVATVDDEIDAIEEKLKNTSLMTEGQTADWEFLWHNAKRKQRTEFDRRVRMRCDGCRDDCLNQQGHMNPGGCLYASSADEAD